MDVNEQLIICAHLLAALLLAIPVGWNNEKESRTAGLRTFPLVSLGACAYILIGQTFIPADAHDSMARLLAGLLAGIGFIGGGAILKKENKVEGTAAAASIWITGALGTAVALNLYIVALVLTSLNFSTILILSMAKQNISDEDS